MDVQEVCKKIFDFVLPYADKMKAPVSYINVEVGCNFQASDDLLWNTFNEIRWDTVLSSAELFIVRRPFNGVSDDSLRIVSLAAFEDENGDAPIISISDGYIEH